MLNLTRNELDCLLITTAVTLVAALFVGAVCLWRQEQDIRRQAEALKKQGQAINKLWAWCTAAGEAFGWTGDDAPEPDAGDDTESGPADPTPPGAGDTVISHPADTFARKQALLPRYTHIGQHRS